MSFHAVRGPTASSNVPKGEVSNPALGAIPIRSFSLGAEMPVTLGSATGGAGTGKAKLNSVKIKKSIDASSPSMFANLTAGQHMKTAHPHRAQDGSAHERQLSQLAIQPRLLQQARLVRRDRRSLRISYARTTSTGALSPPTAAQWNQVTNNTAYPL